MMTSMMMTITLSHHLAAMVIPTSPSNLTRKEAWGSMACVRLDQENMAQVVWLVWEIWDSEEEWGAVASEGWEEWEAVLEDLEVSEGIGDSVAAVCLEIIVKDTEKVFSETVCSRRGKKKTNRNKKSRRRSLSSESKLKSRNLLDWPKRRIYQSNSKSL